MRGVRQITSDVATNLQYKDGEPVRLCVNTVRPYHNKQETYNYYYLLFRAPRNAGKPKHKWGGLGEVLQGNELIDSQMEVKFKSEFVRMQLLFAFSATHHTEEQQLGHVCCKRMHKAKS